MARHGLTHGVQLVGEIMRLQHADHAALGHSINFDEPAGPAFDDISL